MISSILLMGSAVLVAAFIRGLTGFGFALAAVPLFALATDPLQAVTITVLLQVMIGISDLIKLGADFDRREVGTMGLGAAIGLPFGMVALLGLDPAAARLAIAVVALCGLLLTLRQPRRRHLPHAALTAGVGFISGIFSGLAAMPGPPAVAYFLGTGTPARQARASLMVFFLIAAALTLPGLIWAGAVTTETLLAAAFSWPLLMLGSKLGQLVFLRMGEGQYRAAAIAVMAVSTALAGWRGLIELI